MGFSKPHENMVGTKDDLYYMKRYKLTTAPSWNKPHKLGTSRDSAKINWDNLPKIGQEVTIGIPLWDGYPLGQVVAFGLPFA